MGAVFPAGCQVMIRFRANQAMWAATCNHGPGLGTRERVGLTGRLRKPIVREPNRLHGAVLRASRRRGVPDAG